MTPDPQLIALYVWDLAEGRHHLLAVSAKLAKVLHLIFYNQWRGPRCCSHDASDHLASHGCAPGSVPGLAQDLIMI